MDKSLVITKLAQTEEDCILLAKVYDKIMTGVRREIPAASCFLSPRERILVQALLRGTDILFFGGTAEAERTVCCYLPKYLDSGDLWDDENSPVCAVRAEFYAQDTLTHRDFLGSLMGCGIKRETVGDIFVSPGCCDFLLSRDVQPYVLQNLESAGRTKLHLYPIRFDEISAPRQQMKEISTTVSSLRLDSVVGSGFGLARGKAAAAIESGRVSVNDMPVLKPDKVVAGGEKIALRGMGKIRLSEVGGRTKRGRLSIKINRYG